LEKRLKKFEPVCICGNCPTCLGLGEEGDYIVYCFPTREKSKKIKDAANCVRESCRVYEEMDFTTHFSCTRGTEEQQRKAESER
jgi:hypothetical protein